MVNWENAEKVLDIIDANPEGFDMGGWQMRTECGTTRCIAGWAAMVAGWRLKTAGGFATKDVDGIPREVNVGAVAADFLGLMKESERYDVDDCDSPEYIDIYERLFSPIAFVPPGVRGWQDDGIRRLSTNEYRHPSTDDIRARLKTFDD